MTSFLYNRILILLFFAMLPFTAVWASTESYMQSISGKIKKGDSCTVIDDKFLNMSLVDWNQVRHLSVDDIITFELRRDTGLFYGKKPFTCTLTFTVKYFDSRDQSTPKEIDNVSLKVRFDTASGKYYPITASYKFKNAFKVTVIVNSISSPELGQDIPAVFRINNQILVERTYPFDKSKMPSIMLSHPGVAFYAPGADMQDGMLAGRGPGLGRLAMLPMPDAAPPVVNNQLNITWQAVAGAVEYDVEWAYIDVLSDAGSAIKNNSSWFDGSQLLNIPATSEAPWMLHNNSRVTVKGTSYAVDLPYPEGFVLVRVRSVSYDASQLRQTTPWQYTDVSTGHTAGAYILAHQPNLNWQYTVTFSEEGRRKEIISYFDASLRSRQTVTIRNNDNDHTSVRNIAVVSETIYDNMGRPTMNILPAPVNSTILQYYPALNKNGAGVAYSRDDIGSLGANPDGSCNITAAAMLTTSGASQYYSASNPFLADPTNYFFAKYIPNAGGKPFSLTEYTADNTNRIRRQGGVGDSLQIGAHDTRYFYGKPSGPRDLERLFGREIGDFSHYEKNLVVDPNGQISVKYLDANGRTVAAALAGEVPPGMDALPSANGAGAKTNFNQVLVQPTDFSVDAGGLYKSASTTFSAPFIGSYTLHYNLSPAQAVPPSPHNSTTFCSNCYYDITIDVKDNCGNLVAHDYPATPPFPGSDITCHSNTPPYTGNLVIPINNIGEYTVIYKLKLSETEINFQTEYYINNNTSLRTIQNYFEDLLPTVDLTGCYDECSTCIARLGTLADFTAKMQALLIQQKAEKYPSLPASNFVPNSTVITNWISTTYTALYNHCVSIQNNCSAGSACEQKKQMLKNDIIPGGQYALFDQASLDANASQVFLDRSINVPLLRYHSMPEYFTADNGTQVHAVDDNGTLASGLSEASFIRAYQNHLEWADYFVQFHIEYCSYLWCKDASNSTPSTNMEVSYNFDQNLQQVYTSGDLAVAKGYYDHNNMLALLNYDPFFSSTGRGYTYRSSMTSDLQNYTNNQNIYMKTQSGTTLTGKDIISYIDWLLYCAPASPAATGDDFVNSWNICSPVASCRSITKEWQLYRNYYLALKVKYVQLAKQTYNPSCRNCFVGNDGFNTTPPATCVSMVGSPGNPAFSFNGMTSYSPTAGGVNSPDLIAAAWTCNAFGVPTCNFRSLFKWDLSSLPANATIVSATLNLYPNNNSVNGYVGQPTYGSANASFLRRVTSAWTPGTTGWSNQPSVSTTDQKVLPQSTSTSQAYTVDITSFANLWKATPSSNYGMMLQLQNETYYNSMIFGGPGAPAAIQPVLQICYTTPSNNLGVNAPILTAIAACNASAGTPPPCPTYTEFGPNVRNIHEQNNVVNGTGFYSKTTDIYIVHAGGPVARDVVLNFQLAQRSCYNCSFTYTYPQVTIHAGQSEAYVGQTLLTYAMQNYVYQSYYSEANYTYSNQASCPAILTAPSSSCITDPNYALYQNKTRVFNEYVDQTCFRQSGTPYATDNAGTGYSTASLTAMRQAATIQLDGLKAGWLGRLQAVRDEVFPGNPTLSDVNLNNLVTKLYNVAQAYVNVANESNIHAASTLPVISGSQVLSVDGYKDFQAAFTAIVGPTLMAQGFSQELLDKPYPWDQTGYDVDPVISETSTTVCTNLNNFKTAWTNAGTSLTFGQYLAQQLGDDYNLTDAQLTDLQNKCAAGCTHGYLNDGMAIPVALAAPASHAPLSCTIVNGLVSSFAAAYPTVTFASNPKLYKLLFTNYANHAKGYSLSYYEYSDFTTNCPLNATALLYDKPAQPQVTPDNFICTAGVMKGVFSQAGSEYDRYLAIIRRQFRDSYISNCLANQAGATMSSQNWEYNYSLYYYDQSGNLVKTIPPEGVQLLTDDQIDLLEQLSTQSVTSCPAFPSTVVNDKTTILNGLSASLQNNTALSVETWLYSTAGPATRNLRFVTADNKYMYQAAVANNKLWVELYTLTNIGPNNYTITLANRAVADLAGQLPLQTWSHLVFQSSSGLAAGAMQLYLDGIHLPLIPNGSAPAFPNPWIINISTGLPVEDLTVLKHLRIYNRIATDAEITANYKNSCMGPVGALATTPLTLWGRFNLPGFCSNPTNATPVSIPDRGAMSVTSNPNVAGVLMLTGSANNFTVEFWANPTTAENFYAGEATDIYAGTVNHNYCIFPTHGGAAAGGIAGMGVAVGTNGVAVFEHADSYMPAKLLWQGTISGWTHVAIVYTNKTPSLYINGNFVATGTVSTKTYVYPSYNFGGGGYGYMPGSIDEVRIWGTSRTGAQIFANYNKSITPDNQSGLLGYWPMDGVFGNVVKDATCNGNNVTFYPANESWTTSTPAISETNYIEYADRFIVPNHGMPTNYAYNSINEVIRTSTPDGGVKQYWFDRIGRRVVSQNAEQLTPADPTDPANRFSYTKYDQLDRITEIGEKINIPGGSPTMSEDLARTPASLASWLTLGNNRQVTLTAYDSKPAWSPSNITQAYLRKRVSATALLSLVSNPALPADPSVNRTAASYFNYDVSGNISTVVQENTALINNEKQLVHGIDGLTGYKTIQYDYDLISGRINKLMYEPGKWDQFNYQYVYDADNRLIRTVTRREGSDGDPLGTLWTPEASYTYYPHGPLARTELGNQVQGIDYAYTLQGWVKGINGSFLGASTDMSKDGIAPNTSPFGNFGRDAVASSLVYYQGDYRPIGLSLPQPANAFTLLYQAPDIRSTTAPGGKNLFNGNISAATYALSKVETGSTVGYTYRYDQLNRLKAMDRHNIPGGATTWNNSSIVQDFHEAVTYDANGNIRTYIRNGTSGTLPGGGGGLSMDNMTYGYNLDVNGRLVNNRLRHIKDAVGAGSYPNDLDDEADDNYGYDRIGNLVADPSAGIGKIKWNVFGKIESITRTGVSTITYAYDAGGHRINKTVADIASNTTTVTHYVRDGQGSVLAVYSYKFSGSSTVPYEGNWLEQHIYGRERIGMINPGVKILSTAQLGADTYAANSTLGPVQGLLGLRSYELGNHLRNVMAIITDKKIVVPVAGGSAIDHYEADPLLMEDYYPFGMVMPGRTWSATAAGYRYGFNGKENEDEVKGAGNQLDYGMRVYDPRVGRFLSLDPLQSKFPDQTPYAYAMNRPIDGIDVDGKEWYYSSFMGWTESKLIAPPPLMWTEQGKQDYYNKYGYFTLQQAQAIYDRNMADKKREEEIASYMAAQQALIKIQLLNNPFYLVYEFSPASAVVNAYTAFRDGNNWEAALNVALAIGGLSELKALGLGKFATVSDFFNTTKLMETGVGDLWKVTNNFVRGTLIENKLAQTLYQGYEHLGTTVSKYFKAIDFYKDGLGVSLKTVNAQKNFEFKNIFKNIDDLAEAKQAGSIVSQGVERRIRDVRLDIAIPEKYDKSVLDKVKQYAEQKKVKINIFEAK